MSGLDSIGIGYNTDKSSRGRQRDGSGTEASGSGHDYLRKYEFFLRKFVSERSMKMMELGIGPDWNMGASMKTWLEYFEDSSFQLHMVDINPNAAKFAQDRVRVSIGDLGDRNFLNELSKERYHLILDDASHFWGHQIEAISFLFRSVLPGGIYIVEDIHTSFGVRRQDYSRGFDMDAHSFLLFVSSLVAGERRVHPYLELDISSELKAFATEVAKDIESISFIKHAAIICKRGFYP